MPFITTTISEIISDVLDHEYVLPAIQRHFVWKPDKITDLFDSIIRGYPIGSFLFWKLKPESIKGYQFYDFIKDFNEQDSPFNKKYTPSGKKDIQGILDGQQRITSLLIGLKGSYTIKKKYAYKNYTGSYVKKHLYINLLCDDSDNPFKFLSDEEVINDDKSLWYKASRIIEEDSAAFLITDIINPYSHEQKQRILSKLQKFENSIKSTPNINYYQEKDQNLDTILKIFVRVNSGGTPLTYSDLLLSTATADWIHYDAREEIEEVISFARNNNLRINSDFVLKASLMLSDLDIKFELKNFNKDNMAKIEENWDKIKKSLICTFDLIKSYGYNQDNLSSYNALLPICYYINRNDLNSKFVNLSSYKNVREDIIQWLRKVLIKRIFGGSSDTTLAEYRRRLKDNNFDFSLENIENMFTDLIFHEQDIDDILDESRYTRNAFFILSEIIDYPQNTLPDVDHMYPIAKLTRKNISKPKFGFSEDEIDEVENLKNNIANLNLLTPNENKQKNSMDFEEWVKGLTNEYKEKYFIPEMNDYSMENFLTFCSKRKDLLKRALAKRLGVTME